MHEIKIVINEFLGRLVVSSCGKVGTLASVDIDGHCVIEFVDGCTDCTHYTQIPTVADWLVCQENEREHDIIVDIFIMPKVAAKEITVDLSFANQNSNLVENVLRHFKDDALREALKVTREQEIDKAKFKKDYRQQTVLEILFLLSSLLLIAQLFFL